MPDIERPSAGFQTVIPGCERRTLPKSTTPSDDRVRGCSGSTGRQHCAKNSPLLPPHLCNQIAHKGDDKKCEQRVRMGFGRDASHSDVRFASNSGHSETRGKCLPSGNSGHSPLTRSPVRRARAVAAACRAIELIGARLWALANRHRIARIEVVNPLLPHSHKCSRG
jgi:hypothetical protein